VHVGGWLFGHPPNSPAGRNGASSIQGATGLT